jgi:hypothetical protein
LTSFGVQGRAQDLAAYGAEKTRQELNRFEDLGPVGHPALLRPGPGDGGEIDAELPEGVVRVSVDFGDWAHRSTRRQWTRQNNLAHVRRQAQAQVADDLRELVALGLR